MVSVAMLKFLAGDAGQVLKTRRVIGFIVFEKSLDMLQLLFLSRM